MRAKANKPHMKMNKGDCNHLAKLEAGKRTKAGSAEEMKNFSDGWDYYKRHNPASK